MHQRIISTYKWRSLVNQIGLLLFIIALVPGFIQTNTVEAQTNERIFDVNDVRDLDDVQVGDGACDIDTGIDGFQCTLRAAITEANYTPDQDTINLPAGEYKLSMDDSAGQDDFNVSGDLDIKYSLRILGDDPSNTIINAEGNSRRVIHIGTVVADPIVVTINNIRISGGLDEAIYMQPSAIHTLNMTNVVISNNEKRGLFNDYAGIMNLDRITVRNNSEGGIVNYGDMYLTNSQVYENTGHTAIRNDSKDIGGGVFVYGYMEIINSTIRDNLAPNRDGGGIRSLGGTSIKIASSYIIRNEANNGGGIWVNRDLELTDSVIAGNIADTNGGGIYMQSSTSTSAINISGTTISENSANGTSTAVSLGGGGFYNQGARVNLTNVTLSGNYAQEAGGAFVHGITTDPAYANAFTTLNNVTIYNNRAGVLGGGYFTRSGYRPLTVSNTIIGGNQARQDPDCNDLYSATVSAGNNLIQSDSACQYWTHPDDIIGAPLLDPLAPNGGQTCTHKPQTSSSAVDGGDSEGGCAVVDQRGGTRPQDGDGDSLAICDIGSVELNAGVVANPDIECKYGNSVPTANPDEYTVDFNSPLVISAPGVLGNDVDDDGNPLTATKERDAQKGTVNLNADGSFVYFPNSGAIGEDSFAYVANDGLRDSNTATVLLTILSPIPVAEDDAYSVIPGQTLNVDTVRGLLRNDFDPSGGALTVAVDVDVANGTLSLNPDGSFSYTPNEGFEEQIDSFTYTASNGENTSSPATVTLSVSTSKPTATSDSYYVAINQTLSVPAENGVLVNDVDPNGDTLTAVLVADVQHGILTLNTDGSFDYTPDTDYTGADNFTYKANDGTNDSNTVTVNLTVEDIRPVAQDDAYSADKNTALVVNAPGLLENDTDPNSTPLTALKVSDPSSGTVTINQDGSFTYTPNTDFVGEDQFFYKTNNGTIDSNTATVLITVNDVIPTAVNDSYSTTVDTALEVAAPGVLSNDSGATGDTLTAVKQSDPVNGTLTLNSDGSFTYTPNASFTGTDSFTYVASNGTISSETATVTVTVTDTTVTITAVDDSYTGTVDTALVVDAASGVLVNDTGSTSLTAIVVDNPFNGTLTLNDDGSFTYTPNTSFVGADRFTYKASDGTNESAAATVQITIEAASVVPVAVDDSYTTTKNTDLIVSAPGILNNDTDPDGLALTAVKQSDPANGTLTLNTDGSLTYTPNTDFTGTDSFTYVANNGTDDSNSATVTITIEDVVADAPTAANDSYTVTQNTPLTVDAANGVLANDTDPSSGTMTAAVVLQPLNGTLTFNTDGSFTYTPNTGFLGNDNFTYRASNTTGASNTANVTLTVEAASANPPTANNDTYNAQADTTLTVAAPGVLSNDTDPNSASLTAAKVTDPTSGTLTLNADGSFSYTPNTGFTGTDSFTYQASNGTETSNTATVTILVTSSSGFSWIAPVGTVNELPTYEWTPINGATGYDIVIVYAANNALAFFTSVQSTNVCDQFICSINFAKDDPGPWLGGIPWLSNADYSIFMQASGSNDWKGPFNFTLAVPQPTEMPLVQVTNTTNTRPTISWTLDTGSSNAYWFNIVIIYADNPVLAANTWVSKYDVCDGLTCSMMLNVDLLNAANYSLYMAGWGPGGFSTGGVANTGYAGGTNFSLSAAAPTAPSNLQAANDTSTGNRVFSWTYDPNVSYYQIWIGTTTPAVTTVHTNWYHVSDLNCMDDNVCSVELNGTELPGGFNYTWYLGGWGFGGLTPGNIAGFLVEGPTFTP